MFVEASLHSMLGGSKRRPCSFVPSKGLLHVQGPELTVDNLAALARLGTNATARGDESGEASHQEAMTACEQLSRSFLQRSQEPFEGSDFTSASHAACMPTYMQLRHCPVAESLPMLLKHCLVRCLAWQSRHLLTSWRDVCRGQCFVASQPSTAELRVLPCCSQVPGAVPGQAADHPLHDRGAPGHRRRA